MIWVILLLLSLVFSLPSLLSLIPAGYGIMSPAHLITFLVGVVLLVWLGRWRGRRGRRAGRTGLCVGAAAGALGTVGTAWVTHTPPATRAFVTYLGAHGVPPLAAVTLHNLHLVTSTALTALMAAGFYGVVGGFAAWWGARPFLKRAPDPSGLKEGPST